MTLILALLLACGGDDPATETPAAPAAEAPPAPAAPAAPAAPPEAAPAEAPADGSAAAQGARPSPKAMDALSAEVCSHPCAILTTHDFMYIRDNYCQMCGPHDEWACELDWPTNDVPLCSMYDELRNCIFASYGYSFSTPKWKEHFAKQDWYKPDPSYTEDRLSEVAKRNIEFLKDAKAKKWMCEGEAP